LALELTPTEPERRFLAERIDELEDARNVRSRSGAAVGCIYSVATPDVLILQEDRVCAPHAHRALDLQAPDPGEALSTSRELAGPATLIRRRDLLGGLIHEYQAAAA
jgi:hypothetical protein